MANLLAEQRLLLLLLIVEVAEAMVGLEGRDVDVYVLRSEEDTFTENGRSYSIF